MGRPQSKLTAQGQISIPAEIRRKLGLGPGSVVEWDATDEHVIVRKVGRFTSDDIHRALFPDGPPKRRSLEELTEGIRQYVRERHARR